MTEPIFHSTGTLITLIFSMLVFALWFSNTKAGKNIGPSLTVILIGMILFNTGLVPAYHDIYGSVVTYCVPVAVSIFLLNVDLNSLKKLTRQPLLAMASAAFSVSVSAFLFGLVFADKIEEGWKVAGMFVGTYTGGTTNLTAIATGLNASSDTIAAANAADSVLLIPTLLVLFSAPVLLRKWKWFQKAWPYHHTDAELLGESGSGSTQGLLGAKSWSVLDIASLLALAFGINEVALLVSGMIFPEAFAGPGKMLLLTTFSLLLAQLPCIKRIKGKMDIGMLPALMFLCIIGFMVDLSVFLDSTLNIALFCLCVLVLCTSMHLLITRLLKIKYEYVVLSIAAAVCDGPTAAMVAAGGNWGSLVSVGLILGTLGGLLGNYCGIGVAYLIRGVTGG